MLTVGATLVLVRLLEPSAFGLFALAWAVVRVVREVQGGGIWAALVHRRGDMKEPIASGFYAGLVSGALVYAALYAIAPLVADALGQPDLTSILRAMSLLIVTGSFGIVPSALLERELAYRTRAWCEVTGAGVQAGVSIALALSGSGVWSLVLGHLAGAGVQTALFWVVAPIRPKLRDARARVTRDLLRYARFVSAANVIRVVGNTADSFFVGRLLGAGPLGFYALSFRLADVPNTIVGQIIGRVMFPVYALLQRDREQLWRTYLRNLQRVVLLAAPASVALAVAAEPVVLVVLGEKWEPAVTPLRILALYGLVKWVTAPASELYKGIGKPHFALVFAALQAGVVIPALALLVPRFELLGAAVAMLAAVAVAGVLSLWLSVRLLNGSVAEVARALAPAVACAGTLAVVLVSLLPATESFGAVPALITFVCVGAVVYLTTMFVFARSIIRPMWGGLRGVTAQ